MVLKFLNNINFFYLLIGLIIGLIYGHITKKTKKVIRYNKLEGKVIYEDPDEKCYKYVSEEIKCPNSDEVLEHPITYG
jgi:hypothetical protein